MAIFGSSLGAKATNMLWSSPWGFWAVPVFLSMSMRGMPAGHSGHAVATVVLTRDGFFHSFNHRFKMNGVYPRVMLFFNTGGDGVVFDGFDHMGGVVPAPVGNGCGHVGHLDGGGEQFALANGQGNDGE